MQAPSSPVVDLTSWLINQGPLGVALAVSILLNARLWKAFEEERKAKDAIQAERLKESKDAGEKMERIAKASIAGTRKLYKALGEKDDELDSEE